ncbi:hypothetical protein DYBT9623_05552 [Dyadobacter sp. CECT 9623]|uniref:Uncharacterized protein n=1 Tax=Dyadobacter linearis TaxID=2823330 RepID=A0ABM8UZ44_9BACT|nr:hypothetical protein DYBT9623_05552 [Dyadobacter sp. CECT 9623]
MYVVTYNFDRTDYGFNDVVPFWFTLLLVSKYLKLQFSSRLPVIFGLESCWI